MECGGCGKPHSAGDLRCDACGRELGLYCRDCGFRNLQRVHFCGGCGRHFGALPKSLASPFATVGAYTPKHLAERILRSRAAMEGERKQVTVMFADIRGSFEMIDGRDAEHAQILLDTVLQKMIDAVHRYEGTVNQVLGDGIMALFGAPIAHEDHAVRACYAALAMRETIQRRAEPSAQLGPSAAPEVRVGLHSGEVVIRAIGNDLSLDYRAVGATTHMAARMEQTASPSTIRLTERTFALTQGAVEARALGPMQVKGARGPIEVYELLGAVAQSRFQVMRSRELSPLVGRRGLRSLGRSWREALATAARVVLIEGEPGVGKSRLCFEFVRVGLHHDSRVLEAGAVSYGRNTPYGVLSNLLRSALEIEESDRPEDMEQKLRTCLSKHELERELDRVHAPLQTLLGLAVSDPAWRELDPEQRRQRTFQALTRLLIQLSDDRGLVVVWEDLHWFDEESLAFLGTLVESPPKAPLLLLLTHRAEFRHRWRGLPHVRCIALRPLPQSGTESLLGELLGNDTTVAPLRRSLAERTYGNPFFIEESVRALAEAGVLIGRPGEYRVQDTRTEIRVPATVESVIAARIDRLTIELKELLQAAAVIGGDISWELLLAVSGLPATAFQQRLSALLEVDILYAAQIFPSATYRFKHALILDVVYGGMLRTLRRRLHARTVGVLEELYRDRLGEHLERLAEHSYRGELWEKSASFHLLVCKRAAERSANRDAVAALDRGLECLRHLPNDATQQRLAVDLRLTAMAALLPLGERERILELLGEARDIAELLGDSRKLAAIHSQLSVAFWMKGLHSSALDSAQRALATAESGDPLPRTLAARYAVGLVHHARADFDEAIEIHGEMLEQLGGDLEKRRFGWAGYPSVLYRTFLGSALTYRGEIARARALLEEGCRIADEVQHPYSRSIVREELGFLHLIAGEPSEALRVLETAMEITRAHDVHTMYPALAGRLGSALVACGRVDDATVLLEGALERETYRRGGGYAWNYLLHGMVSACLARGALEQALERVLQLESKTEAAGENAHHAYALKLRGDVHVAQGAARAEGARQAYAAALERAERHGLRPLIAECHEGLAALALSLGEIEQASDELRAADTLWCRIGFARRMERTSAGLAELRARGALS